MGVVAGTPPFAGAGKAALVPTSKNGISIASDFQSYLILGAFVALGIVIVVGVITSAPATAGVFAIAPGEL